MDHPLLPPHAARVTTDVAAAPLATQRAHELAGLAA